MMGGPHRPGLGGGVATSPRRSPLKLAPPVHRGFLFHEAEVGKQLTHPNIIKIVTVNKDPKNPYMVMEFFPGGSLKMRLMRKQSDFLKEHAHNIFKQAATAL